MRRAELRLCPGSNIAYTPRDPIAEYSKRTKTLSIALNLAIATNGNQPWKLLRKCNHQGAIEKSSIRFSGQGGGVAVRERKTTEFGVIPFRQAAFQQLIWFGWGVLGVCYQHLFMEPPPLRLEEVLRRLTHLSS